VKRPATEQHRFGLYFFPQPKEEADMIAMKTKVGTLGLALALIVGTAGYAADPSSDSASGAQPQVMKGTIKGEVKKVQPDAVIVTVDADKDKAEKQEVRLPLNQSTHMGAVGEGDQVIAFVTPGGTTTSIQPLDSRWYR
jgi:Cu/Ag efflux protein CusF